jgi:hypothetical protein
MSARIYVLPRGIAKVDPVVRPEDAAAWWRGEAQAARREAERLSGEVLRALARAQSCERFAARVEQQIPSAQDSVATAVPGSPTQPEGAPDEAS